MVEKIVVEERLEDYGVCEVSFVFCFEVVWSVGIE